MSIDVKPLIPEELLIPDAATVEDLAEAWREARADAARAYTTWCAAPGDDRRLAYATFVAAADREQAAEAAYLCLAAEVGA
jgi:hypothetical protein